MANGSTIYNDVTLDKHSGTNGLLKVTSGLVGVDTNTYLTASDLTPYAKLDGTNQPFTGDLKIGDNLKHYFGTGNDASIYYDGTNFNFNSREVGTGNFIFNNGNVGVGTTAPTYLLDVKGTTAAHGIRSDIGFDIYAVPIPTFGNGNLALAAGAGLGIGAYFYRVTFTTALGETSTSAHGTITTTAGNQQVTVTVPTSTDPRVTGRKIYRTAVGDATSNAVLLTTINDNTTTTYLDSIPDGSLGTTKVYFRSNTTTKLLTLNGNNIFNVTTDLNANTFIGYLVGNQTLSQGRNVGIGSSMMGYLTSGSNNIGIGNSVLTAVTSGTNNISVGYGTNYATTTGTGNVGIGTDSNFYNVTSNYNTSIGYFSSFGSTGNNHSNSTAIGAYTNYLGKSNAINLGYSAGRYETADSTLIIDSFNRSTEAASRSNALIYGVMSSIAANQILQLGGGGTVKLQADNSKLMFGSGDDASITYDGTNLLIDPRVVGTGYLGVLGNLRIGDGTAGEDFTLTFDGETNDGILTWMEDEDYFQFSDGILMDSTEEIFFRDTAIKINSIDDGHLDLTADTSVDINSTLVTTNGIIGKITTVTDTYTVLVSDETVICNKATAFTVTLPTAVVGQRFNFKNIGAGTVTLEGAGSDTIDGDLNQSIYQWEGVQVICIAANTWSVI
jgi:hypothetical protein